MKTEQYKLGLTWSGAEITLDVTLNENGRIYDVDDQSYLVVAPQVIETIDILDSSKAAANIIGHGFNIGAPTDPQMMNNEIRLIAVQGEKITVMGSVGRIPGPAIGAALIRLIPVDSEHPVQSYSPVIVGFINMIDGRANQYL